MANLYDLLFRSPTPAPEYGEASPELAEQMRTGGLTGALLRTANPMLWDDNSGFAQWTRKPVGSPMGDAALGELLNGPIMGTFGGVNAKTANLAKLATAKELAAKGADNEAVRQATGWFKGMDDKWRFEIPDNESKIFTTNSGRQIDVRARAESGGKAWNTLEHEKLYSAYPHLEDINISMNGGLSGKTAAYDSAGNIQLAHGLDLAGDTPRPLLLHELQHAIQEREGFARGGSPNVYYPDEARMIARETYKMLRPIQSKEGIPASETYDLAKKFSQATDGGGRSIYERLAGEIEARDVSARMNLTPEQRLATPPDLRSDSILRLLK